QVKGTIGGIAREPFHTPFNESPEPIREVISAEEFGRVALQLLEVFKLCNLLRRTAACDH
ncbi:MAG: hypothetical protein AAFZ01_15020, partial [Pseudomonadota bacterium]